MYKKAIPFLLLTGLLACNRLAALGQPVSRTSSVSLSENKIPSTGDFKGLVLLVDFPDRPFSVADPAARFGALLNRSGYDTEGARGSVRDYFIANSDSLFRPSFRVIGPLRLSKPTSYYGENGSEGEDLRVGCLVSEACHLADSQVDFSLYDTSHNGRVDMVYLFYAGFGENENRLHPEYIWPHAGNIADSLVRLDDTLIGRYACSPEYMGEESGSHYVSTIGLFCHEFGHVLGLPDFYNTATGAGITPGGMSVMDKGCYLDQGRCPAAYSAFEREYIGWLQIPEANVMAAASASTPETNERTTPADPSQANTTATSACAVLLSSLNASETRSGALRAFKIKIPSTAETFYFENRQSEGWDASLPAHGLLVFHVDRSDTAAWDENRVNTNYRRPGYQLIRSGGTYADYPATPFPGPDSVHTLSGASDPPLVSWTLGSVGFTIRNIRIDSAFARLEYIPFLGHPVSDP